MSSVRDKKEQLRKQALETRNEMDEDKWRDKSAQIINALIDTILIKNADTVHCYISMNNRREVCTDELIRYLFKTGKKVVVPITNFSDDTLSHSEIHSLESLKSNKWGVREPELLRPVELSDLDIIIVPMVAADVQGNRLGYGKGFYDRFLSKTKGAKIGLVFESFVFDEIPVEEFDKKLDVIITEKGFIYRNNAILNS